ncbi:MAG: ribosome hibernation-promoting factor, HPF/YfiA family [Acidimicrobiales bacterium]
MNVTISSRGVRVTPHLEEMVLSKVNRLDRFLSGLDRADVHLSEERNPRIQDKDVCEIHVEGHGHHLHCKASGPDELTAVERSLHKVERGLRKLKTKEVNRHHHAGGRVDKYQEAQPIVIPDPADIEFVNEKQIVSAPMTPVEAVQQMETLGHDFFLFHNADSDRSSVVYRRNAGAYGLLETT